MTKSVGLIGYPLRHSISPLFQQAALDHCQLDVRYEAWETEPNQLGTIVARLRQPSTLGANITIPYKEVMIPLLDELDESASHIGAVNTIVNRGNRLTGHNTDTAGFIRALRQEGRFEPRGKRAVLLGAGGAARAVAFALAKEGGARELTIVNRTLERATALAASLRRIASPNTEITAMPWKEARLAEVLSRCDLIVNCTSIGMTHSPTAGQSPLEARLIPAGALVYDLVYNPVKTPLLREAEKAGACTLGGLSMLVYQGAASFTLWTGRAAPLELMLKIAKQALK